MSIISGWHSRLAMGCLLGALALGAGTLSGCSGTGAPSALFATDSDAQIANEVRADYEATDDHPVVEVEDVIEGAKADDIADTTWVFSEAMQNQALQDYFVQQKVDAAIYDNMTDAEKNLVGHDPETTGGTVGLSYYDILYQGAKLTLKGDGTYTLDFDRTGFSDSTPEETLHQSGTWHKDEVDGVVCYRFGDDETLGGIFDYMVLDGDGRLVLMQDDGDDELSLYSLMLAFEPEGETGDVDVSQ